MSIRRNVVGIMKKSILNFFINMKKKNEKAKFKDERRVAIYSQVNLDNQQKTAIDNLYKNNYGKKIPYIWHRHETFFTGNFDEKYIPENLYIPEIEMYMNYNKFYCHTIEDKNLLPLIANEAKVKTAKTLGSCCFGVYKDQNNNVVSKEEFLKSIYNLGECFIKPSVDSCSGVGCKLLNIEKDVDTLTGDNLNELIDNMGENFIIQNRLICHKTIRDIYPNSVNTFRVITYRWKDEFKTLPIIMRFGRGKSVVDNAHAGGMFIAIDNDGTLHKTAFTEFGDKFDFHPDTNLKFEGYKIPNMDKVIDAAIRCHHVIPQIGCINWDFMLDENGDPVLVEINVLGCDVWSIQIAHGKGAFGEDTAEVLRWLKKMNESSIEEQKKHFFGY